MDIKWKELNNKSRKGLYVYIKEKGKRGAYYKFREGTTIDAYIEFYKRQDKTERIDGYLDEYRHRTTKRKEKTRLSKQTDEYIRKIKKRGKLSTTIKKGITKTTIHNALEASTGKIANAKRHVLEPLVLDTQLLELLIKDENFKKIKSRLEYRMKIEGTEGEIVNANTFNKTPEEVIQTIKKKLRNNQKVDYIEQVLRDAGWQTQTGKTKSIQIKKATITMIFRKGK